jgi:hypothetical protein
MIVASAVVRDALSPLRFRFLQAFRNERIQPLTGVGVALKPHPHRFGGPMRGRSSVG